MFRWAVILTLLAFTLLSREAWAGYVFYSASFGDWSVVCWSESGAGGSVENMPGQKRCSLSAPQPKIEDTIPKSVGRSVVSIQRETSGAHSIALRFRGTLAPDTPAILRVDDRDAVQALPNFFGEANLAGADADKLMRDMAQGTSLVLRSFSAAVKAPRDETIELDGFSEAMKTYDEAMKRFGAVAGR